MIACQIKERSIEMAELLLSEGASADYSAPNKVTYMYIDVESESLSFFKEPSYST